MTDFFITAALCLAIFALPISIIVYCIRNPSEAETRARLLKEREEWRFETMLYDRSRAKLERKLNEQQPCAPAPSPSPSAE